MQTIQKIMQRHRDQILYLIFGGLTTVVSITLYVLFAKVVGLNYTVSYLMSWFFSVLFAYVTNRIFVFQSTNHGFVAVFREMFYFFVARIATGIIGYAMMWFGVSLLHQNDVIWNVLQNVFVIVSNYVLSKVLIFKKEK